MGLWIISFIPCSLLSFQSLEKVTWRFLTKKTNMSTWKKWSCFSRLQKNGCFSTCFAEGRFWGSIAIICSINSLAMTSSTEEEKKHVTRYHQPNATMKYPKLNRLHALRLKIPLTGDHSSNTITSLHQTSANKESPHHRVCKKEWLEYPVPEAWVTLPRLRILDCGALRWRPDCMWIDMERYLRRT